MSKWNLMETDTLSLIFQNSDPSYSIGGTSGVNGSSTAGSLYIALFTADPDEAGAVTNEAAYTSYTRIAVARSSAGWTVSSGIAYNAAAITFPTATGGTETITHYGICKAGTASVADLIFYGAFTSGLAVTTGVTPQVSAGNITATES